VSSQAVVWWFAVNRSYPSWVPDRSPDPADAVDGGAASSRRELAALLRSRRERLQPEDVGLPAGSRRRTRGLRREEVALLAAVSPTYYTFLEQGRDIRPSAQVLDALAQALRLSVAERTHLYHLAHGVPPADSDAEAESLDPAVAALVSRLDPAPTYVTGRRWDVLAANRGARMLFADWPALPRDERNMLWWMFTAAAAREVYVEWEREAAALLARFRSAAGRRPADADFRHLIDRLLQASPEARAWWPRHEILPLSSSGTKRLRHPALGVTEFQHVVLQVVGHPDQKLVTFSTEGDEANELERLAGWVGADQFPVDSEAITNTRATPAGVPPCPGRRSRA
jgi:transcriptional regulator with XRE-family HTH domain